MLEEETELITNQTAESLEALNFDEINVDHETDDEIDVNLSFPLLINLEDYCETMFNDAINDKLHPSSIEWPNDIYQFIFKYRQNYNASAIKTYGKQFESDWWYTTEKTISINNNLLPIIIYANATTCNHLSKTSEYPIYISLVNILSWLQNKLQAKVLIGYLLKLKAKDSMKRNSKYFQKLQRLVFQRCLQILLKLILNQADMHFVINNEIYPFTPKISVILTDMAEPRTFTLTYFPSTSKRSCSFCLINNEDLNNMTLSNVILRILKKM
ncbi:15143_t:CDS:2 [Funneliformis mosseae]|uniref:15143_t:CDS:1 n=1 Tax=Funneliformis mosseae TaxID=27381 RepID=A0A9N9HW14_FUNMO|nr:15143_t:CDS:2 [Funneliformis mosseae]